MKFEVGEKYLITTQTWFIAPDGNQYRAAFGTYKGTYSSKDTLGVDTNRHSTNWYVSIGNVTIAGCQIYYCVKTGSVSYKPPLHAIDFEGKTIFNANSRSFIYDADRKFTMPEAYTEK